jgi:hypothetical protein
MRALSITAVHDDCAHKVAHIRRFAACAADIYAIAAQFFEQFLGAADDGCDNFSSYQLLIAPYG